MADVTVFAWLEDRLRQEEQVLALRHRILLDDLGSWQLHHAKSLGQSPQAVQQATPRAVVPTGAKPGELQPTPVLPVPTATLTSQGSLNLGKKDSAEEDLKEHRLQRLLARKSDRISALVHGHYDMHEKPSWMAIVVSDWKFETFFAVLIVLNALTIGSELQYNSYSLGWLLGWSGAADEPLGPFNTHKGDLAFQVIDIIFGVLFWMELALKLVALRANFFFLPWAVVDLCIMILWTIDWNLDKAMAVPPTILRILRLVRLVRLVRFVKEHEFFDTLILMMSSVKASLWVLFWSICLLLSIMLLVGLIFSSTLQEYMKDETASAEKRLITYRYFGSFSRSMVSMFEITLGNWVPICRHLSDNVTERFGLAILIYRLFVCEGILKVISAIFLQQTMQCANNDDQLMVQNRVRQRARFVTKMKHLLAETDSDGDGTMSRDEFARIMAHPRIKLWLQAMELNIRDPDGFFSMVDKQGDGQLDVEELVSGMSLLKGPSTQLHMEATEMQILSHLRSVESSILWLQTQVENNSVKVSEVSMVLRNTMPQMKGPATHDI